MKYLAIAGVVLLFTASFSIPAACGFLIYTIATDGTVMAYFFTAVLSFVLSLMVALIVYLFLNTVHESWDYFK